MTPARRLPRPLLRFGLAGAALALTAVLFAPSTAVTEEPAKTTWEELRSEEGNLVVWLPGTAEYAEAPPDAQGVVLHTWTLKPAEGVAIIVSWSDIVKPEAAADAVPELILQATKAGLLGSLRIQKAKTERSTISGCPALLVTSDAGERLDLNVRFVQAGIRTYAVAVVGARGKVDATLCRMVLESFKVLDERKIVGLKKAEKKGSDDDEESLTEDDK